MKQFRNFWLLGVLILLSLIPFFWFRSHPGALINGVDTNFPLDPVTWFSRRFFVWQSVGNAGSDFSSSTSGLFFHLVQVIPYVLGLNLQLVEIFSLVFWFGLIIFSAYVLARLIIPKSKVGQFIFVVLYAFNTYIFNTWENVKVANLSLIAAIPLGISLFILLKEKRIGRGTAAFFASIVGIILSGSGINPSYFATFFMIFVIYFISDLLVDRREFKDRLKDFLTISIFCIAVNAYWIFPTVHFIFSSIPTSGSIDKIGFNNWLDSLSENTSLLNILRVQGAWDWYSFDATTGMPLYIPYSNNYFNNFIFIGFSFLIPVLAFVSFIFRRIEKKSLYVFFGILLVLGVFLGSGTHMPTGSIYNFFVNHVPFFTLFRSPWYIFTPMVTLSYAGLISLIFSNFEIIKKFKPVAGVIGVVFAIAVLVYSYPLVTGRIFRPGRDDGFFINFPSYVFSAQKWLSKQNSGRIIGYPPDEIEKFDWGYRGVESFLQLLADTENLYTPLNAPDAYVSKLIKDFYESVSKNEMNRAFSLAAKLNLEWIFKKNDESSLAINIDKFVSNLDRTDFGSWSFYHIPDSLPKIYSATSLVLGNIVDATGKSDVLINSSDGVLKKYPELMNSSQVIKANNSQEDQFTNFERKNSMLSDRLQRRTLDGVEYSFSVSDDGDYSPILEKYRDVNFDGETPVLVDGKATVLSVARTDDSYVYFNAVKFSPGSHKIKFNLESKNLLENGNFESGVDLNKYSSSEVSVVTDNGNHYLQLLDRNPNKDVSYRVNIPELDPYGVYLVNLKYKQIYGNNPNVILNQRRPGDVLVKSQVERLPDYPEWVDFSFYFQPVITNSSAEMEFMAPSVKDPLGTKVLYDDISLYKLYTNKLYLLKENKTELATPKVDFKKISPVEYAGTIEKSDKPYVLSFSENYSPDWELSIDNKIVDSHFTVNEYANGWYVKNPVGSKFKIYYKPQRLFNIGEVISVLVLFTGLGFLAKEKYENRKH